MENSAFSTISLFIKGDLNPNSSKLTSILDQFEPIDKQLLGTNLTFNLDNLTYEEVKKVLGELAEFLDSGKRSQATIFDDDGTVHCITINNGEMTELAH